MIYRILLESYRQAMGQLSGNKLRTLLSLLGISIGIFCIIAVKSAVDSLEVEIRDSFNELGDDVIYISKRPWNEDPGQNYWKYMRRPEPNFSDFRQMEGQLLNANLVSMVYFIRRSTLKFGNNALENVISLAITEDYGPMFDFKFESGRYFSPFEYSSGANSVILGSETAEELFQGIDPIGQTIRVGGNKYQVIGVLERKGESLINIVNYDFALIMTVTSARKYFNLGNNSPYGSNLAVKLGNNATMDDLKDELEYKMRVHRRLKPVEDNNFALNEMTMLTNILDGFFRVINIAGFLIGIFALFVGMFSVANIMFVSVKERTNIIGIKKALGAKYAVILLEFLIESIILCIIGGAFGLLLVFLTMKAITAAIDFNLFLSLSNITIGIITSIVIGILAGILPAISAAKLDPVEAMRK